LRPIADIFVTVERVTAIEDIRTSPGGEKTVVEVPRDLADRDIATICQSLRVDAKRKCFVAIAAKKRPRGTSSRTSA